MPVSDDHAQHVIDRKKLARARERERAKERYREKTLAIRERHAAAGTLPRGPGRPRGANPEQLRPVMIGRSMHAALSDLAAKRSYKDAAGNVDMLNGARVSMRELVEQALAEAYPGLQHVADAARRNGGEVTNGGESVFEEIIRRAMSDPGDPENGWYARGSEVAYSIPSTVKAVGNQKPMRWEWTYVQLISWLSARMDNPNVTDLHTLVEEVAGRKFEREGAREGA